MQPSGLQRTCPPSCRLQEFTVPTSITKRTKTKTLAQHSVTPSQKWQKKNLPRVWQTPGQGNHQICGEEEITKICGELNYRHMIGTPSLTLPPLFIPVVFLLPVLRVFLWGQAMKKTADGHVTNLTKLSAQNPCKLWNQMFAVTISTAELAEVFGCFD